MRAVDTNILVRFLTADDEQQARISREIIIAGDIFIPTTVVLETEWVLRAGYGFTSPGISSGLRGLGGLPGVTFEEPGKTAQALDWLAAGMDFADALHLATAADCAAFLTFDRRLAKRAKSLMTLAVELV